MACHCSYEAPGSAASPNDGCADAGCLGDGDDGGGADEDRTFRWPGYASTRFQASWQGGLAPVDERRHALAVFVILCFVQTCYLLKKSSSTYHDHCQLMLHYTSENASNEF